MNPAEDTIVPIAPQLERFFGCSGRMLKPSPATVAALIAQIPSGKLLTKDALQKELASRFGVEVTCPFDTKMALKAIAHDSSMEIAAWRVVKKNGELMAYFPGGLEAHAALLIGDGFEIDASGKTPRVEHLKSNLFAFDKA